MDHLVSEYLGYLENIRSLSPRSIKAYTLDMKRWVEFLASEEIEVHLADQEIAGGFLLQRRRSGLSPAGVNRQLGALRGFYRYLVKNGKIAVNPFSGLRSLRSPRKLPKVLRPSEISRLLSILPEDFEGTRDRLIFELLYATGCRASELLNLPLTKAENIQDRFTVMGKGKKERVVFLTPQAKVILGTYLKMRSVLLQDKKLDSSPALLISRHGHELTASSLAHLMKKRLSQAGILRRVTPHTFRHTFATHILEDGADIRQVQELLGHANVATTQIYTHVGLERLRSVLKHAHPHGGES